MPLLKLSICFASSNCVEKCARIDNTWRRVSMSSITCVFQCCKGCCAEQTQEVSPLASRCIIRRTAGIPPIRPIFLKLRSTSSASDLWSDTVEAMSILRAGGATPAIYFSAHCRYSILQSKSSDGLGYQEQFFYDQPLVDCLRKSDLFCMGRSNIHNSGSGWCRLFRTVSAQTVAASPWMIPPTDMRAMR